MGELELIEKKHQVLWRIDAKDAQKHLLGWKMLENNKIPGLLPFDYYYVDNEIRFCYDYSSLQRLEEYFKIKEGDFETIFFICEEILKILEKGQEYLLDLEGCLLLPEWIFWNRQKKKVKICFLPGKEGDVRKEYATLVEYLMKHTNHSDEKLVTMIYGLYDRLASDNFLSEQLLQYLQDFCDMNVGELGQSITNARTEERDSYKRDLHKKVRNNLTEKSSNSTGQYFLEPYQINETVRLVKCLLDAQDEKNYLIADGESVVGRAETSGFYIPFREISRRHALLISEPEELFVMDTASKNGTYVNGNRISAYVKTFCKEDDVITFADISYKVRRK